MPRTLRSFRLLVALAALVAPSIQARDLTFEERVAAQGAIERVYYAHQVGATKPFEQALPRAVLEAKVEKYMKQSAALERFWQTPVTAEMLQAEMERQASETRMPARLRELYAALGDDPFLVRECLARPALVDRLTRSLFAFDASLHTEARQEAEELREGLLRYGVAAFASDPRRREVEIVEVEAPSLTLGGEPQDKPGRMELSHQEFARWRARAPQQIGAIGPLREEREAFVIDVVLEAQSDSARIASFAIAKRSWDSWWQETAQGLDASAVGPKNGDGPLPAIPAASCPPDDVWTTDSLDEGPPRALHTAVWTGNQMIVWGGHDNDGDAGYGFRLSTGNRYDPVTSNWSPTSLIGAPTARDEQTAVWTGSEMIVWGGLADPGDVYLGTGGRYDPVTDSWAPTSTVGAPFPRHSHTAVWTGSQMIVWGGDTNTGGRYDPATDSWTPTSIADAPALRRTHTAVWTGSEMIVWGGFSSGFGFVDTGGRYDPVSDSWMPTSLAGAPSARELHTAKWTGSLMIVWGGFSGDPGSPYQKTGARYDPVSDSWTPTLLLPAPSRRVAHTAVWTGNEMIVWGGFNGSSVLVSGGRYDPATNTWTPTSTAGAPPGAWFHTAVWTGNEMIVWGGAGFPSDSINTGGRYSLGESYDADADGLVCAADCNDFDGGVFAVPEEVTGLGFLADGETLGWDSAVPKAGSATMHDVLTGVLGELPVGSGAGEACLDSTAAASIVVSDVPFSGSGTWYLVRAENSCGAGTYGSASDGTPRTSDACP